MARNTAAWLTDSDCRPAPLRSEGAILFRPIDSGKVARHPAQAHGPSGPRGPLSTARSKVAGRRLGRYRLIERLGRGAQGDVWKALQLEPVVEEVALKVLPPTLASIEPWRMDQFRYEAEVGASLSNPSLLPIYEFAEINGITFFSMPFIDGGTLAEVIDQRRRAATGHLTTECDRRVIMPKQEYFRSVACIFAKVAGALQVAHGAGFIHRDVKPSNILLDRERDDRVYLLDFGLGFNRNRPVGSGLREGGVGSPLYMPPEKLVGLEEVDEARSDIYALGVSLFEALTLEQPVAVPPELPRAQWAEFLVVSRPQRPRGLEPAIPETLERIVLKAMQRNAASRYSSALELVDDLRRFLDGTSWTTAPEANHRPR